MLVDLLDFATTHLVDDGRLSFWMPTANDEDVYLAIPTHPSLDLVSVCVQPFNKCQLCQFHASKHLPPPSYSVAFLLTNSPSTRVTKTSHISKTSRRQYRRSKYRSRPRRRNQRTHRERPEPIPETGTFLFFRFEKIPSLAFPFPHLSIYIFFTPNINTPSPVFPRLQSLSGRQTPMIKQSHQFS